MGNHYQQAIERCVQSYEMSLASLQLQCVCATKNVRSFRMAKHGTRINSVQITETREGLVIQGDLCPGRHGVCSDPGYDLDWFARSSSPSYLAEKFLTKCFVPEGAADRIEEYLEDSRLDDDARRRIEAMARSVLAGEVGLNDIVEFYQSMRWDVCDIQNDYPIRDYALLSCIQKRFEELYQGELLLSEGSQEPEPSVGVVAALREALLAGDRLTKQFTPLSACTAIGEWAGVEKRARQALDDYEAGQKAKA